MLYRSRIKGLGFYVPENVVTNDDLSKLMDTSDEWIQERTGIQQRHHALRGSDTTTSMGVKASLKAIEAAKINKDLQPSVPTSISLVVGYWYKKNWVCLLWELLIFATNVRALSMPSR